MQDWDTSAAPKFSGDAFTFGAIPLQLMQRWRFRGEQEQQRPGSLIKLHRHLLGFHAAHANQSETWTTERDEGQRRIGARERSHEGCF